MIAIPALVLIAPLILTAMNLSDDILAIVIGVLVGLAAGVPTAVLLWFVLAQQQPSGPGSGRFRTDADPPFHHVGYTVYKHDPQATSVRAASAMPRESDNLAICEVGERSSVQEEKYVLW